MVRRVTKKISGYRKSSFRNPKKVILIALGGKNKTEKLYFSHFNKRNSDYNLIIAKGNVTDPVNMVRALIIEINKQGLNFKHGDKVYCVFDADDNKTKDKQIKDAITVAKNYGIEIIISNPCFEEWILCHFEKSTAKLTNNEAYNKVKKYIKDYHKSYDVYPILVDKTSIAVKNAKIKEKYHINQGRNIYLTISNPSSLVYKIVENLK